MIFIVVLWLSCCTNDRYALDLSRIKTKELRFLPEYYIDLPDLPSPALSESDRELVLIKTGDGLFGWIDATVENGEPFNYKLKLYGKGNQLLADAGDFPGLALKGLHAEAELRNTKIITGRSVSRITVDGRPWGSSGVGFMAEEETIMSVIRADNRTVAEMGLTHPDLARPLFHIWNISRDFEQHSKDSLTGEQHQLAALMYNGYEVQLKITGSRGWQESIFDDEILGSGHIEIWREMETREMEFLERNYTQLSPEQFEKLQKMLFYIHTGEMVFFYINRYGFYEGHAEYRVDPIAAVLIFGLRSLDEVHEASGRDLYRYFTTNFTENPE